MKRTLIADALIVSMDPALGDLRGDILIEGRTIAAVGRDLGPVDAERIEACGRIAIPGLVDCHRHVWQTPLRSVTADWSLMDYVTGIRTCAAPVFRPEDIYIAQLAGALEMLDAGITTVVDYSHNLLTPDHAWEAIRGLEDSGIRALWCAGFNVPPGTGNHFGDTAGKAAFLREVAHRFPAAAGRLVLGIAPEELALSTPDDVALQYGLARELGARISHHVHSARFGRDPREIETVLGPRGLLGPDVLLVHMNFTSDEEWRRVADSGAAVVFTPETELQMGMGFSSTARARALGLRPSIGADIVSNNGGDLFVQLRLALQAERALANEPGIGRAEVLQGTSVAAREALAWATVDGAAAAGMAERIGRLAPGMAADIVLLDGEHVGMLGWAGGDPAAHVVMQAHPGMVDAVIVDGRVVKRDGRLVADLEPVRRRMAATTGCVARAIESKGGFGVAGRRPGVKEGADEPGDRENRRRGGAGLPRPGPDAGHTGRSGRDRLGSEGATMKGVRDEVAAFFDDFVEAFGTFSGARIAGRYIVPGVAVRGDGSIECLRTRAELERFFQATVDGYRAEGCHSCRFTGLEAVAMGSCSVLATVTWELLREDGSVLRGWRQSYNLVRVNQGWQILASTYHVEDPR
jgi:cytosine/adenosine deaminase-related metal-dependent hydrolase